jgi:hypothetical protein
MSAPSASKKNIFLSKIVSGGQSGVDRAAVDFAIKYQVPYGGWIPKGGWAEDYPKPPGLKIYYQSFEETPSSQPEQRTEWNVRDSDATLVLTSKEIVSPGVNLTVEQAVIYCKPLLVIDLNNQDRQKLVSSLSQLFTSNKLILNIAGPRESQLPGVYHQALTFLEETL